MGVRLTKAYELATEKGGSTMRMRLAMKTNISSEKAKLEPDSEENIKKFKSALKELLSLPKEPEL